jgi:hypothetical protein
MSEWDACATEITRGKDSELGIPNGILKIGPV